MFILLAILRIAGDFGLHFYNARWYDSSLSRFAQADTIIPSSQGVQGYDRYAYVSNNPVKYTDPTGRCPWCYAIGVGAIAGAAVGYGAQVYDNYQNGLTGADALTTNISAEPIVNGAFIGAGVVLGVGLIATAPIFAAPVAAAGAACKDGDCTNEAVAAGNVITKTAQAINADGDPTNEVKAITTYYPPNNGFTQQPQLSTLQPGSLVDRYGSPYGSFLSPAGTCINRSISHSVTG